MSERRRQDIERRLRAEISRIQEDAEMSSIEKARKLGEVTDRAALDLAAAQFAGEAEEGNGR